MEKSLSTILTRSCPQHFPFSKTLSPILFFRSHCLTHRGQTNPQLYAAMYETVSSMLQKPLLLAVRHVSFPSFGILRFYSYEMPILIKENNSIGSCSPKKLNFRSRLRFVAAAQFFESFSVDIHFDSKTTRSHDSSQMFSIGPVPGDIAEVEAYCRIFRAAEQVHASLMHELCDPLSGECSVSYDFTPEEKTLFEDKVVSVLGCMVSLLNKGKDDVLSGRSSSMCTSLNVADVMDDQLPPLAIFRSEMKKCCESLHVALEYYWTPNDRCRNLWMKLQRLKNVCYDLGFTRGYDCPCHTLFSNWNSIYISSTSENGIKESTDSKLAFQCGGQVTEEGLKWLIRHGYKTIVDLRAESVKDAFYERAIEDAISSGNMDLVKIPVEKGNVPSMEQVEKFASLVSDSRKTPIYLHSKEGVWRTSTMVSRWRQYMYYSNRTATSNNILSQSINGMGHVDEVVCPQDEKISVSQSSGIDSDSSNDVSSKELFLSTGINIHSNESCNSSGTSKIRTSVDETEVGRKFWVNIDPLKAQLPPCNFFSKKEMSRFFTAKKISPLGLFHHSWKGIQDPNIRAVQRQAIVGKDDELSYLNIGCSNGSISIKNDSDNFQPPSGPDVSDPNLGILYPSSTKPNVFNSADKCNVVSECSGIDQKNRVEVCSVDDLGVSEGNMCASTTGVVRVQSRKKAEMFLVRTDGFKCTREKVTESSLAFSHPTTQQQMLMWKSTPKTVLLLKKLGAELIEETKEVVSFLYYEENMDILVEPDVHDIFARIPGFGFVQTFYVQDTNYLHERVDFVACLGGDGVILHASNIFRGAVPPVLSFNLGSLGFLTTHAFEDHKKDLRQVIHGNNTLDGVYITLRMRLRCEIFRNGKSIPGKIFDVLNEVVVDRGSNPYLSKIECYERDLLITKVQGDGVIVATPTGSTAYSTSAGGSMVHPNVPCILLTPICPHSLSFRPVILPDSAKLELKIPEEARSNLWVSFDGKKRQQLWRGDSVRISMSQHPIPTVNKFDQTGDWFHSLIRCLKWNERQDQKGL